MYAAPPVVAVPVARRAGLASAPALAISCLLFILFLIAATIVLALIPIYLPRKDAGTGSPRYYVTISYNGTVGADGALDAQARANLARALEAQYGLPTGSVVVSNLVAVTTRGGKRKRQERGLRRIRRGSDGAGGTQIIVGAFTITIVRVGPLVEITFTATVGLDKSNNDADILAFISVLREATEAILAALGLTESETTTTTAAGGGAGATTTTVAGGGGSGTTTTTAAGGGGSGTTTTTAAGGGGSGTTTTTAAGGATTSTAAGATTSTAAGATTVTSTTTQSTTVTTTATTATVNPG